MLDSSKYIWLEAATILKSVQERVLSAAWLTEKKLGNTRQQTGRPQEPPAPCNKASELGWPKALRWSCGCRNERWPSSATQWVQGLARARVVLSSKMSVMCSECQRWWNENDGFAGRKPSSKAGSVASCICLMSFIMLDRACLGKLWKEYGPYGQPWDSDKHWVRTQRFLAVLYLNLWRWVVIIHRINTKGFHMRCCFSSGHLSHFWKRKDPVGIWQWGGSWGPAEDSVLCSGESG